MIRLNKLLAERLNISRRKADTLILNETVTINGLPAKIGQIVDPKVNAVLVNNKNLPPARQKLTILFNKPKGFVCSKNNQGNNTIYDILPKKYHHLNPIGRLDKNSTGLLILTSDGKLNFWLSHPSQKKQKVYHITLNKPLFKNDYTKLTKGVELSDGPSKLLLSPLSTNQKNWQVILYEGRNRQIRRSFDVLGYKVITLTRVQFGNFKLNQVPKQGTTLEL